MAVSTPEVKFCYRCGRRIDPARPTCWYCGAEKNRELRPPKRCPFCAEYIAPDAIKCKHCGEFVDGRHTPQQTAAPPQQIVYVVDKEILRAARDRALPPGQPVPRDVADRLDPQTVHAIETNQPLQIEMPGVRALPAPEVIDVGDGSGREVAVRRDLARQGGGESAAPPARLDDSPYGGGGIWAALGRLFDFFRRRRLSRGLRSAGAGDENIVDTQLDDRFRKCESCGVEILRHDNYCFHCGMQYHLTRADSRKIAEASGGNPALSILLLVASLVLLFGHSALGIGHGMMRLVALVSIIWGLIAMLAQRGAPAKFAGLFALLVGGLLLLISL